MGCYLGFLPYFFFIFSLPSTQPTLPVILDNTPYVIKKTIAEVLKEPETVWKSLFTWLTKNEMMANANKRHLFLSSVKDYLIEIDGSYSVKKFHRCSMMIFALRSYVKMQIGSYMR